MTPLSEFDEMLLDKIAEGRRYGQRRARLWKAWERRRLARVRAHRDKVLARGRQPW